MKHLETGKEEMDRQVGNSQRHFVCMCVGGRGGATICAHGPSSPLDLGLRYYTGNQQALESASSQNIRCHKYCKNNGVVFPSARCDKKTMTHAELSKGEKKENY